MLGILDRFERQAVDEEQLLTTMSDEDLVRHAQNQQQQQQQKGGSSGKSNEAGAGAGAGTAGSKPLQRKLTPKEREELIRKAMEEEAKENALPDGGDENIDPEEQAEMERMVEQEYQDFVKRFAGVDLDQESFESIWERLNPDERREFQEKFVISGRLDEDDDDVSGDLEDGDDGVKGISDDDIEDEEMEAKRLLQEMGETLERGGQKVGSEGGPAMTADLDMDDLKAIRDAEIAELIQIWRPWWEVEAEESGQLKKVVVSKVTEREAQEKRDSERLKAASNILQESDTTSTATTTGASNIPGQSRSGSDTVLEQLVLDEEAMLRPHQALVRPLEEIEQEAQQRAQSTVPPMTKAPHPSLIYHICGLLFAFAATIRVFNGDLQEEPEQVLAHIFDLCPFFTPPPPASKSSTPRSGSAVTTSSATGVMQVEDFETTLAVLQTSSLNSTLWKGDTVRLEMLSLLLRDLTLILARPSRCLRCIRDLEAVFQSCLASLTAATSTATTTKRRGGLYSKTTLHRLLKKLEFYESYLLSEELFLKSDSLDRLRTEVVMAGIRVRQEIVGWTRELEQVSRVAGDGSNGGVAGAYAAGDGVGSASGGSGGVKEKKVLIEELS